MMLINFITCLSLFRWKRSPVKQYPNSHYCFLFVPLPIHLPSSSSFFLLSFIHSFIHLFIHLSLSSSAFFYLFPTSTSSLRQSSIFFHQAYTLFGHIYSLLSSGTPVSGKDNESEKLKQINNEKALKCYLMALQIDPLNQEAGWGASEIYMEKSGEFFLSAYSFIFMFLSVLCWSGENY